MKGIENMFASMIGIEPEKLQVMMSGFVDNAAYVAENMSKVDESLASLHQKMDLLLLQNGINPPDLILDAPIYNEKELQDG